MSPSAGLPGTFSAEPVLRPCEPWIWHNAGSVVTGPSWGGNLEILSWLLMADRAILPIEHHDGGVLFLETSDELPTATEVYRILRNMGERGRPHRPTVGHPVRRSDPRGRCGPENLRHVLAVRTAAIRLIRECHNTPVGPEQG
ncbi:hypothetical protein DFR68_13110 [Nocardia mexicana]|uniref:LD-carboxypeptidase C-terminal domain-containing protein n=1 Tax=Nocardia mexicana TaxID=279262 RepID=A0A370GDF8_9NOCA|nr:hypothetical protein DFR68_13110 [Nocardia mexicana]